MSSITVHDVVFNLKELLIAVDSQMLRRIEWAIGEGNYEWMKEEVLEEVTEFTLQFNSPFLTSLPKMSIDDFLCEKGISMGDFRQAIKDINKPSGRIFNESSLDFLDQDSSTIIFAHNNPDLVNIFERLRNLGLSHNQCKGILGLGVKSYDKLKKKSQTQKKDDINRRGRSEDDAWSFAKHVVSTLCLDLFKKSNDIPIFVLETHQGVGDASMLYSRFGNVLGFESHEDSYNFINTRMKSENLYQSARNFYMDRENSVRTKPPFHVFIPDEKTPSEKALKFLDNQGIHFNAIDIDPWISSQPFFGDALKVLEKYSLLMMTLGDQHPWPKGEPLAWERFGVDTYNLFLADEVKRQWRKNWMLLRLGAAWYMKAAIAQSVCLLPIVIMRNFEPWTLQNDFAQGIMGIDRIYFLAKQVNDLERIERVFETWTEPISFFGNSIIKTHISSSSRKLNGPLSFISFGDDIWPTMKLDWNNLSPWLIDTVLNRDLRLTFNEPADIVAIRHNLSMKIEKACHEKLKTGYQLAESWLRTL